MAAPLRRSYGHHHQVAYPVSGKSTPTDTTLNIGRKLATDRTSKASRTSFQRLDLFTPPKFPVRRHQQRQAALNLLEIDFDVRRRILEYLLSFETTTTVSEEWKDPGVFFASDRDDQLTPTNGLETVVKTNLHIAILGTCKQLCDEGRTILRMENRFLALEGLDNYSPIAPALKLCGKLPCWPVAQMAMRYNPWPREVPNLNIVTRISETSSSHAPGEDTYLFPASCAQVVCQALSYLPAERRRRVVALLNPPYRRPIVLRTSNFFQPPPTLILTFPRGLSPTVLGRLKWNSHKQPFVDSLLEVFVPPVGKWVQNVDITGCSSDRQDVQRLDRFSILFVKQMDLFRLEPPNMALHRQLQTLITDTNDGERIFAEAYPAITRKHYSAIKQKVYSVLEDVRWQHLITQSLRRRILLVSEWACIRIGTLPIVGESDNLRMASDQIGDINSLEALWSEHHLKIGGRPAMFSRLIPRQWRARVYLRRAELGYMLCRPIWECTCELVLATLFLAPLHLYGNNLASYEHLHWVFEFHWGAGSLPTTIPSDREQLLELLNEKLFEEKSWIQMCGGKKGIDDGKDREVFLHLWAKIKTQMEEWFGVVGKLPVDFARLLDI